MNTLILSVVGCLALVNAAPSGHGTIITGPSGIVTGHGAIGPVGAGLGWGAGLGHGALLAPAAAGALIAGPVAHGAVVAGPVAHGAVVAGPALGLGHAGLGWGLGLGHGAGVITNGGGAIGVSGHGVTVQGPPTAPAVVAGPAGRIVADGLWGPTANIGWGAHGHGHW